MSWTSKVRALSAAEALTSNLSFISSPLVIAAVTSMLATLLRATSCSLPALPLPVVLVQMTWAQASVPAGSVVTPTTAGGPAAAL